MRGRQRQSLSDRLQDTLLLWGFVLTFAGLVGAAGYEAGKIVAAVPGAFESMPVALHNPMTGSEEDYMADRYGRTRMTPQERARNRARAAQQER